MIVTTYKGQEATFYIQAKGLNAGKPLRSPIANCFAVDTEIENAYEIVFSLWKGDFFRSSIGGSVIPFIRIADVKKIVGKAIKNFDNYDKGALQSIKKVDKAIENTEKRLKLLKELQVSLARKTNKDAWIN